MRKFLSVLLAVAMMLSLSVTTFAAEDDLVIAPAPGETDLTGTIVILHTNDVHGGIEGYAKIAAAKKTYEDMGADVLLFDAGDFSQGTTYVSVSQGATAIELMNLVGYDACTLGNHEFDYGYDNIKTLEKAAEFPILAANIIKDGKAAFDAHTVFTTSNGTKIGVFGLDTPETATKAHPAKIAGVKFLDNDELFACAQKEVDALKAEGCDYVICLGHLGIDNESIGRRSIDLLEKVTGIDVFFDGHSHSTLEDLAAATNDTNMVGDTLITSTGTKIDNMGVVIIEGDGITALNIPAADMTVEPDAAVAARVAEIIAEIEADFGATFAKSEVALNGAKAPNGNRDSETNNGDLITDAMLWYATKDGGLAVDNDHVVALTNGGGIRAPIAVGDVSKNNINTVLPFGNTVAIVYVTGAELLEALEASTYCTPDAVGGFPQVSGIEFKLDTTKAYDANAETYPGSTYYGPASINRVTITGINGKAFDPKATYAVVTNDFCAAGGDTYYAFSVATVMDTGTPMDVALMDYITEELGGVIGEEYAAPQGRITIKANPFTDASTSAWYYGAVDYCVENGLMQGTSTTTFDPTGIVTRAQVATVLYNMAKEAGEGFQGSWMFPLTFTDAASVPSWANEAVHWCSMKQVVEGYDDGRFDPNAPVTREQFATMLYRYAKVMEVDTDEITKDTNTLSHEDIFTVSEWAAPGVHFCIAAGVIGGDDAGKINPQNTATRVEMAAMLQRYCENVAK